MPTYVTKVHRTVSTTKPWNSVNAKRTNEKDVTVHFVEEQEDIDLCLSCPLPPDKCYGIGSCYKMREDSTVQWKRRSPGHFERDKFESLCNQGLSNYRIAATLGVTRTTVAKWRKKLLE